MLFHGLSAEGAKASVNDMQTPDDPSYNVRLTYMFLGRFVFKVLFLSKHFMGPCESVGLLVIYQQDPQILRIQDPES